MDLNKNIKEVIDHYNNGVVQIATPYSTGTGFYLSEYDIIVTNEHVVRDNQKVVIASAAFEKQKSNVLYVDPKHDLAFLDAPKEHSMPHIELGKEIELFQGDQVIAVGHPFGLKYTATQGIISNLLDEKNDVRYIQHDAALNPGNSGGPLIHLSGKVIGINTFIIRNGNNIGFSLPISYLIPALEEFAKRNKSLGVRCLSCDNIVFEEKERSKFCSFCGANITMISDLEPYQPTGINKTLEEMLSAMGFDIDLSRQGPNNWQIHQGSAIITVSYHGKTGLIVGDAHLCSLPKENIQEIYTYLLQRNYDLESLTFSVRGKDIVLSLLIYDQYLNVDTGKKLFMHLFEKADYFDDILMEEYGAEKQASHKSAEAYKY